MQQVYPVQQGQPIAIAQQMPPDYLPPSNPMLAAQFPPDTWNTGLCDCFSDMSSCCEVLWCAYCQMGYQNRKVTTGYTGSDCGQCCLILALDMFLTCGLALAYMSYTIRDNLRKRWNIEPQEDCKNCCIAFFCSECSLCQTYRELSARGYWPQGVCVSQAPPVTRPMGAGAPMMMLGAGGYPQALAAYPAQQQQPGYGQPQHQQQQQPVYGQPQQAYPQKTV